MHSIIWTLSLLAMSTEHNEERPSCFGAFVPIQHSSDSDSRDEEEESGKLSYSLYDAYDFIVLG